MRRYLLFFVVSEILVLTILAWIGMDRFSDFTHYHRSLAQQSTSGVAAEVASFVSEKKRLVSVFAGKYAKLINNVASQPDMEELRHGLETLVEEFFPDFFVFNIANTNGKFLIDDFEGAIGDLCLQDSLNFVLTGEQRPRIHPNSLAYHFDIIAATPGTPLNLFISFKADIPGHLLRNAQTPGHQLMLLYTDASMLIEVTADGARINWPRNDYRLSENEESRILHTMPVAATVWDVVDLHDPTLFIEFQHTLFIQSGFIFILYTLIAITMYKRIEKIEVLRRRAEQHKDEFLSNVNHELRTPLTAIRGALTMLYNGVAGELHGKIKEMVGIALNNSDRLILLVNDILDIQKMEAGKMELDKQCLAIDDLINRSIESNAAYGEPFGVCYQLVQAASGVHVLVDENRFFQVMSNLLSNAAKYGAADSIVGISIDKTIDSVRINVTNHGPGIPDDFRDRLFQKFAQADNSNTRSSKGTGLGLNIVKQIVELHGGKVGFHTRTGEGSTFYVDLPLATSNCETSA